MWTCLSACVFVCTLKKRIRGGGRIEGMTRRRKKHGDEVGERRWGVRLEAAGEEEVESERLEARQILALSLSLSCVSHISFTTACVDIVFLLCVWDKHQVNTCFVEFPQKPKSVRACLWVCVYVYVNRGTSYIVGRQDRTEYARLGTS